MNFQEARNTVKQEGAIYKISGFDVARSNTHFKLSDSNVLIYFNNLKKFFEIRTPLFRFGDYRHHMALANTNTRLPSKLVYFYCPKNSRFIIQSLSFCFVDILGFVGFTYFLFTIFIYSSLQLYNDVYQCFLTNCVMLMHLFFDRHHVHVQQHLQIM